MYSFNKFKNIFNALPSDCLCFGSGSFPHQRVKGQTTLNAILKRRKVEAFNNPGLAQEL